MPSRTSTLPIVAGALILAGCGGSPAVPAASGSAATVAVTARDDSCRLDRSDLGEGTTTFTVRNEGSKVTEVYVYGAQGGAYTRIVGEAENIGPGTSRDLQVALESGTYEVACKPGQTGDGIRTRITVGGGTPSAS